MARPSRKPQPKQSLSPIEKIRITYGDARASFYATNAFEATLAVELLETFSEGKDTKAYLASLGRKARGSQFKRSGSEYHARQEGLGAIYSKLHGMGDVLANARQSHRALSFIKYLSEGRALSAPETTIQSLVEDEGDVRLIVAPLARFALLHMYAQENKEPKSVSILRTNRNLDAPELWRPGANKRIDDVFTGKNISENAAAAVDTFAAETSVVEMRRLVPYALLDQEHRGTFWENRLSEVPDDYQRLAKYIVWTTLK